MKNVLKLNNYVVVLLLMVTFTMPCYAQSGNAAGGILAVLAICTIVVTLILGYLIKRLLPLLKVQLSNWVIYIIAFVVSFALLCAVL